MGRLYDYQEWNTEMNACYTCDTSSLYIINKATSTSISWRFFI